MEATKDQHAMQPASDVQSSFWASSRKKTSDGATFFQDMKDHIHEFIHTPMDEHKTCFTQKIKKIFGKSEVGAETNEPEVVAETNAPEAVAEGNALSGVFAYFPHLWKKMLKS